eukprot:5778001-Karenia_brevis.AAC.1
MAVEQRVQITDQRVSDLEQKHGNEIKELKKEIQLLKAKSDAATFLAGNPVPPTPPGGGVFNA